MLNESSFINGDDLYLNMDKWKKRKECNILFVTGLSGSGKSTLMDELCEKYGAEPIEIDGVYRYRNEEMLDYEHLFVRIFFKMHPEFKKLEHPEGENVQKFFDFLVTQCHENPGRLFVMNGLQIYEELDTDFFIGKPMVIKGTSMMGALWRQAGRGDIKYLLSKRNPKEILGHLKWMIGAEKQLKGFKKKMMRESCIFLKEDPNG